MALACCWLAGRGAQAAAHEQHGRLAAAQQMRPGTGAWQNLPLGAHMAAHVVMVCWWLACRHA